MAALIYRSVVEQRAAAQHSLPAKEVGVRQFFCVQLGINACQKSDRP